MKITFVNSVAGSVEYLEVGGPLMPIYRVPILSPTGSDESQKLWEYHLGKNGFGEHTYFCDEGPHER